MPTEHLAFQVNSNVDSDVMTGPDSEPLTSKSEVAMTRLL